MNHESHNKHSANQTRAAAYFHEQEAAVFKRTDRIFSVLLPLQLLAACLAAVFLAPVMWRTETPNLYVSDLNAIILSAIITAVPLYLTIYYPGKTPTRYTVAVGQMLMSSMLIHITGGRIETHFHIFGSLAFLACYRDWKVLIPATLVATFDHFFRGCYFPLSMYGAHDGSQWRWLEHGGWIIFTDVFLVISCRRSLREMWKIAHRSALLEASEERYRAVIEQMTEGIMLLDPESFRVVECNEAFVNLLGCRDMAEAKSLTGFDFDLGDKEEIRRIAGILRDQGKSLSTVRKYRRRDDAQIYVEITARFISYDNTEVICVNIRDITERKKAEVEVKRLALVAEKTQNSVIITDPAGKIQWVNNGFTRLTGYRIDEVIGRKPGSFLQGEKTSLETIFAIRQAIETRKPFAGELYNYGKDGRGYWISTSIMPINNARGQLKGFIAVQMNISERKAMEAKLRKAYDELEQRIAERTAALVRTNEQLKNEVAERQRVEALRGEAQQFLRKVIDDIPSLIFVKDINGRFILVNRALARIYGTTPEKMIGRTYADFHDDQEDVVRYRADDELVVSNLEEKVVHEEKITDARGNTRWFQTVKRPLIGDAGVESILGIATDLTERKILESQLRHAQKLESIGQLAAGIAHEINTPTQYVGDNTRFIRDAFADIGVVLEKYNAVYDIAAESKLVPEELLDECAQEILIADLEYLKEEIPKAIEQSLEGVSRIAKIVQSMKDFAHPGTSEKVAADLNKAIESTITVARNEWKYVAEMETSFDRRLPLVPCLLGEINQVVLNMIINASHAIADVVGETANEKGKITVSTVKVSDDWAEIRIGDTGTGIAPEIQGKIFDPFFTTKEVGKGTGQGLAISHTVVVEKHGGKLSFETVPGKGTTFIIGLPLDDSARAHAKGE